MEKVVIYGVGDNYIHNARWIKDNYEIVCFADGNPNKEGMVIDGKEIVNKSALTSKNFDAIIVTPSKSLDIIKELMDMGIAREKLLVLNDLVTFDDVGRRLSIAFFFDGAFEESIFAYNYVICFLKKFQNKNTNIKLFFSNGFELIRSINMKCKLFDDIYELPYECELNNVEYDVVFCMRRYPKICHVNKLKVSRLNPDLIDYIFSCEKFEIFNPRYFASEFVADGLSSFMEINRGHKRIQQPDIYNLLGISEHFNFDYRIDDNVLYNLGLTSKHFMTVHINSDIEMLEKNNMLWEEKKFEELLVLLKEHYPEYEIIIIGEKELLYDKLNIARNYTGKLIFEELMTILYHAILHIDTDSSYVQLRHAVNGGKSVVLFGPMSEDFYGYDENINIRTNACPTPCEGITDNWKSYCINKNEPHVCMKSLTPKWVINEIKSKWG